VPPLCACTLAASKRPSSAATLVPRWVMVLSMPEVQQAKAFAGT